MSSTNLTQTEAEERARLIKVEHYSIFLDVRDTQRFHTRTVVTFTAREAGSTFIDLRSDDLRSARLDGAVIDTSGYDPDVGLQLRDLALGQHTLEVEATVAYSRTGEGLHRAVDPADNKVYLYTQFEVADAKRVFACFDQPDMKATYDVTVTTNPGDKLITNEPVTTDGNVHTSRIDYPLPTYLLAFCVGPYAEFTDTWTGRLTHHPETPAGQPEGEFSIPLGLWVRASVAKHLDSQRLFRETKQGFDFFHRNFGVRYPFSKYDQVFVPEFNAGAMENAGCVTIRDEYVFTSAATRYRYERRAETMLHEMAHMWFGDLVTMQWWGDLWLNESFATWAAAISQAEETEYDTAWVTFANVEKAWAYAQDQLPTTHPISTDASDIETVEQNFDGITYAKGASVLKQLQAYVGRENFFAGVRRHFANHAWGNATFDDLLGALADASGRDLSFWADQWLKTTGVNTLSAGYSVDDNGDYDAMVIRQAGETLRTHRIAIGLYNLDEASGMVTRSHRVELDVDGEFTEVPELLGLPAADLVLVNDDDLSYALIDLGPQLKFVGENLHKIADPMARTLCWSAAWQMTRDATMRPRDFVHLVARAARAETEFAVLERLLAQATQAQLSFSDPEWAATDFTLVNALLDGARHATPERALVYEQALAELPLNEEAATYFVSVLESDDADADAQWRALTALVARGDRGSEDIDALLARDNTASGHLSAEKARAAIPTAAAKQQVVESLLTGDLSNLQARYRLQGLTFGGHGAAAESLLSQFNSTYVDVATDLWQRLSTEMSSSILSGIYPSWDISEAALARTDSFLEREDLSGGLRRQTLELRDAQARALRNRETDAGIAP